MSQLPVSPSENSVTPGRILAMNTIAFTVCFAVWLMYGALLKYLTSQGTFSWSASQMGVLIAAPILTGAVTRLPVGIMTDKYGGRPVFTAVLLLSALGVGSVYFANSFMGFLLAGLCFGVAGASFAVGIAFVSVWFKKERQGTALGIFGAGNTGAAVTLMLGPKILNSLTENGANPEGWRSFPLIYAALLIVMAAAFWLLTENKMSDASARKSFGQRMAPLRKLQVWRFGFYYLVVFGGFVGLSGWLVKYYVDVYGVSLQTAGWLAAAFSLPSGVIRAFGGWWSDRSGARTVMYWILSACTLGCLAVSFPMDLVPFTGIMVTVGAAMGIGMAAVYKHIPVYFPDEVGVVGGIVGVLGGLGGFVCPIVFGYLLTTTASPAAPDGLWTTAWMFIAGISATALVWMHFAIKRLESRRSSVATESLQAT